MPTSVRSPIVVAQCLAGEAAIGARRNDQRLESQEMQGIVDRGVSGVGDGDDRGVRRRVRARPPTPTGCRSTRRS